MPQPQPVILLPPSEGKALGGDGAGWAPGTMADPALDRHRKVVLRQARAAGASGRRAGTMPAMERYTGVLYKELAWASLSAEARRRGESQVRIVSGLLGLVAPADPIPHYKLKMAAALPEIGRLATWWRPRIAPVVAELTASRLVWDLLPVEHSAAIDWLSTSPKERVTVRFVDASGKAVSHWNKLLKGSLVRWVLTARPTEAMELAGFDHPLGYRLDPEATTEADGVITAVLRQVAAS